LGRLAGFSGSEVRRVAESLGWEIRGVRGDHWLYTKLAEHRNLSIPGHHELREGTLRRLISSMGLSVDEFLRLASR